MSAQTRCHLISCVWSVWISPGPFWRLDVGLCNQNFVLRLSVFSKGDLKVWQLIHLQYWTIILCYKLLPTNTKPIFWVDADTGCAGMQEHICTTSRKDSPRLCHPQRREKQQVASPLQVYEILFKIPAGFSQLYLPPSQTPKTWLDIQGHCTANHKIDGCTLWLSSTLTLICTKIQHRYLHCPKPSSLFYLKPNSGVLIHLSNDL